MGTTHMIFVEIPRANVALLLGGLPAPSGRAPYFRPGSANWRSVEGAFGMDFANYTIGRLVEDRGNYDDEHPRFRRISGRSAPASPL